MTGYDFLRTFDEPPPDAWRPLDRALAHWVRAHGGSAELASVAAWASLADGAGDTALPLLGRAAGRHGMAPLSADAVARLRGEALVGDGDSSAPTPFVLDADGRFALWRNHAHAVRIATQVAQRCAAPAADAGADLEQDLDLLFGGDRSDAVRRQRDAVAAAVGRRLFVLTGGPGTGKTTTVLRILLMLQRVAGRALAIQAAAPTGKAAQRLVQSLRAGRQPLEAGGDAALPEDWQALLERIPDRETRTVHRLLGYDPRRNVFTRGTRRPIAADVVVVDEASMLDPGMLRALLDAVREDASLILVGDADQLTSVAAGSVLMDLVAALERRAAPQLVRLEHSFRAERHLVPINDAVRAGQGDALAAAFADAGDHARRETPDTPARLRRLLDRWADALAELPIRPRLVAPPPSADAEERQRIERRNAETALEALRALAARQLLCALREEAFGASAVQQLIEQRLRQRWEVPDEDAWYAGRAVLVTRNDYALRLFNGDVGIALADAEGALRVWFETTRADGVAAARSFAPATLPAHEGAFAITIHKSQGSEYARAAVLLPPDPDHRILSRQLLYTGVSRAKRDVELWATDAALRAALSRPVDRVGGLETRLARSLEPGRNAAHDEGEAE